MKRFDCLSPSCPVLGPHLLEASAGTGKTFSIEHLFVRLLLSSLKIEEILLVTFTKAATRELKTRVRTCLEKALRVLNQQKVEWKYLEEHVGSSASLRLLEEALDRFDQAQIFTIHGFCFQMLEEFFFEAKIDRLSFPEENGALLRKIAFDFLDCGIDPSILCSEQISLFIKEYPSTALLIDALIHKEPKEEALLFSEIKESCKAALQPWNLQEDLLLEDFRLLETNYKQTVKGSFEDQIRALFDPDLFPLLLKEKGSLFDFFSEKNQKAKIKETPPLSYPGFFSWGKVHLKPLFEKKPIFALQKAFAPVKKKVFEQEGGTSLDQLLSLMEQKIQDPSFQKSVQNKYQAVMIDEFQDTDALQWQIFQTLFFKKELKALYLVGDPKQSIYRFRKADIYTYLAAKKELSEEHHYVLDTNFRSSKSLIEALNALFENKGFFLPKTGGFLPYLPVQPGAQVESDFQDTKGAIHVVYAEGEDLFENTFLPYAVSEIERLHLTHCALLVKDRYQAQKALDLFKKRGIEASLKSQTPLGKTQSFQEIQEFLKAIATQHPNQIKLAMSGPLYRDSFCFSELKKDLQEKGLVFLAKKLPLNSEMMQIFEHLFLFEKEEGFSFKGLFRCLEHLKTLSVDEGGRKRMQVLEEGVQIMTLHISKGLEFEVVFALGLSTKTPLSEDLDEIEAEKMRQLYVAMTRAKKRLYLPFHLSSKEPLLGTLSPMELFASMFHKPFLEEIHELSKTVSITYEKISSPYSLPPPSLKEKKRGFEKKTPTPLGFEPSFLSSFTSLATSKPSRTKPLLIDSDSYTLQTMPKGIETGLEIHSLFEALFDPQELIFKSREKTLALLEEKLHFSPLKAWKNAIQEMVFQVLCMPFEEKIFLKDLEKTQVEMEFIYSSPPHFIQGLIDLVFCVDDKMYFIDWKTNLLESYTQASLQEAVEEHEYGLQAKIYAEALERHFRKEIGGIFYVFLRGPSYLNLKRGPHAL